jgi:hypothetical protein
MAAGTRPYSTPRRTAPPATTRFPSPV